MTATRGFTLVELMAVVAIIAILASIGYPAYTNYVLRGRIAEATSGLASRRVEMEQWFQDNRTYATSPRCTEEIREGSFVFRASACDASTYTLEAAGAADGPMFGFRFTINERGTRTSDITRNGWANPNPNTCWATRPDGSCA